MQGLIHPVVRVTHLAESLVTSETRQSPLTNESLGGNDMSDGQECPVESGPMCVTIER